MKTQWLTCPLRILGSPENFAQRSTKDARKKSYFRLRIAAQEKFSFLGQLAYLGFQYLVFQELFFSFWRRDRLDYKEPSNNKDQQQHGRFTLKTRAVEFILGASLRSCWKKSIASCTQGWIQSSSSDLHKSLKFFPNLISQLFIAVDEINYLPCFIVYYEINKTTERLFRRSHSKPSPSQAKWTSHCSRGFVLC